ncbi:MAG: GtrA family protein [Clostridiales bacterium]|nr:GtrA family protein [Clostridiales bacterium]
MDKIFLINIIIKLFRKNKYTNLLVELYYKYKEIFDYLFFGGLVTIVNFISYYIPANIIGVDKIVSNLIAFIISVIFAYVVNKEYVFETKWEGIQNIFKEFSSFVISRIGTGLLCDILIFAFMINILNINDVISKIFTQILVVILNYIIGKWFVFKQNKN